MSGIKSFLQAFTEGELDIFEEMIQKMISSLNANIYREAKNKKIMKE